MKKSEKQIRLEEFRKKNARATVKYLRIAPRKVRPVINEIRYQHPEVALQILSTFNKKAARMAEKVVKTAIANAKVLGLDETLLTISDVRADGGPMMKRFIERSMGRGDRILKRTTHLSVVLSEGTRKFKTDSPVFAAEETKETGKSLKAEKAAKPKKKAAAKA